MISQLNNIIVRGLYPYNDEPVKHTIFESASQGCANFDFVGYDCEGNIVSSLLAEVVFNPVEYESEIEKSVNSEGREFVFYHRKRGRVSFNGICDETTLTKLQLLTTADRVEMGYYEDGSLVPIYGFFDRTPTFDWRVDVSDGVTHISVVVSFAVINPVTDEVMDTIAKQCCGTVFDNVEYEPCELPLPADCDAFQVSILWDNNIPGTLTAGVIGEPAGDSVTHKWFRVNPDGTLTILATGPSIGITGPGSYRVNSFTNPTGCSDSTDITITDGCGSIAVTLQYVNGLLIASPNQTAPSATYTWKFTPAVCPGDPPGVQTTLPDTGMFLVPTEAGEYVIEYDLGNGDPNCTASATLVVNDCAFVDTPTITRVGSDLTVDVSMFCSVSTITWEIDTNDDGTFDTLPDTTETITITDNGRYRVTVDGIVAGNLNCAKQNDFCVFTVCDVIVTLQNLGAVIASSVSNCEGLPTYYWEQQLQPGPWEEFDAPGESSDTPSIAPVFNGNYRLTVTCANGCVGTQSITWFSPTAPGGGDGVPSQLFNSGDNQTEFVLTNFSLAPLTDPDEINARYVVYRNGVRVTWIDPVDLDTLGNATNWSWDQVNDIIKVPASEPLFTGDWIFIADTLFGP